MRRGYKKRTGIGVIAFVVLVICGIVAYKRVDLDAQSAKLMKDQLRLHSQIEEQEERSIDIEKLKEYTKSKKYIEKLAREIFGLVYKDEIIIKPEDKE